MASFPCSISRDARHMIERCTRKFVLGAVKSRAAKTHFLLIYETYPTVLRGEKVLVYKIYTLFVCVVPWNVVRGGEGT